MPTASRSATALPDLGTDALLQVYGDLVRQVSRRTGSADTARDLVHDTWLRLAEGGAARSDNATAYLVGAARNLAIDQHRRRSLLDELVDDAALRVPDSTPDVADHVSHRQALRAVERSLAALPERVCAVFLAHRIDGVGHDELAERHGVSRSTIERDVQRADAQLAAALGPWQPAASRRRRGLLSGLLGLGALGVGLPTAWSLWRHHVPQWQVALETPRGRTLRQALPDGSDLALDAASAVEVRFTAARRSVALLRGGAFFAVAHDTTRPFHVTAGDVAVTVLGTRFAVDRTGDAVCVAVESGRVRVSPGAGRPDEDLVAGDRLTVTPDGLRRRRDAEAAPVAPWRTGWLSFDRAPLGAVAERLARYRPAPIDVDGRVADLPVTGEIRIASADTWLRLLPGSLPVQATHGADGHWSIAPR